MNLSKVFNHPLVTLGEVTAISMALKPITGTFIPWAKKGDGYILVPSEAQADEIAQWILVQLDSKKDPNSSPAVGFDFDFSRIWPKVVFRKWWPYMAGLAGTGFILGYVAKKSKGKK